jgi:hypothetical protein
MKKNRYIIISVIVLAVIALLLIFSRSETTFNRSLSDFALDDSANVTKIFMSDKNNNSVTLNRIGPGKWLVDNQHPASKFNVEMLLQTMLDLAVKYPVANAAQNNVIRELAVNSVKVEVYQMVYRITIFGVKLFPHEKLTKVYYVGGATASNQGTFMLMERSNAPFVTYLPGLRGFVSPRYSPMARNWRDYNVFKATIPEIAKIRVEIPETPGYSYEVVNNHNNTYTLVSLEDNREIPDYDTLRILNFLSGFRNLNYEAILNDIGKHRIDSVVNSQPFIVITLTDTSGLTTTMKTFHKKGPEGQVDPEGNPLPYDLDRLYAQVNDGKDFVIIQYFAFSKVLRPKTFFLKEPRKKK